MQSTANFFRPQLPKNLKNKLYSDSGSTPIPTTLNVNVLNEATSGQGIGISGALKVDTIEPYLTANVTVNANTIVNGDLTVNGQLTSVSESTVDIQGRYLFQGGGNTINTATTCGLIQNILPGSTSYALSGDFIPGDGATNAHVAISSSAGLSPNMIVQVSGSASNNRVFEVASVSGGFIYVRGTALALVSDFATPNFVAETAVGANLTPITVTVLRGEVPNILAVGQGNTVPITFRKVAHETSSPTFNATTTTSLALPSVATNNALTRIVALDGSGNVGVRQVNTILSGFLTSGIGAVLVTNSPGSATGLLSYTVRFDNVNSEVRCIRFDSMAHTMISSGAITFFPTPTHWPTQQYQTQLMASVNGDWEDVLLSWDPNTTTGTLTRLGGQNFDASDVITMGASSPLVLGINPTQQINLSRFT